MVHASKALRYRARREEVARVWAAPPSSGRRASWCARTVDAPPSARSPSTRSAAFGSVGLGPNVEASGLRPQDAGFRIQDAGFRMQDAGCRTQGSGLGNPGIGNRDSGFKSPGVRRERARGEGTQETRILRAIGAPARPPPPPALECGAWTGTGCGTAGRCCDHDHQDTQMSKGIITH
ncbi:hypothetical protein BC628DRAFT_586215 [Trametes gibbosa]|nr:hypothetical protein BC628DRAFT_586215 [Trametes gibbosa]